jgi:sterol desaturase/sphingolipid hydroxylase (fatty acid hydroxylase superfamily)
VSWILIESRAYWLLVTGAFLATACWESLRPKGQLSGPVTRRWSNHAVLHVLCTVTAIGLFRVSPVIVALGVASNRWGLLNKAWLPFAVRCVLAVLLLDLLKYAIHFACHSTPFLWRVHQVHHSDPDFDVSTAWRFHPIELLLTQGAYLAAVAILAPPPAAVLAAELLGIFESFVGHANASFPAWVEKRLRSVFVTPDMHRIHHSERVSEQTRNYGDVFPWWDHLFGTYLASPAAGKDGIVTGLKGFQDQKSLGVVFMLAQPFKSLPEETAS